jgi:hypothetical protein
MQAIQSGDVVEFDGPEGPTSALVLLAHDDALILDLLDDSTPVSVLANELTGLRVFVPESFDVAA